MSYSTQMQNNFPYVTKFDYASHMLSLQILIAVPFTYEVF